MKNLIITIAAIILMAAAPAFGASFELKVKDVNGGAVIDAVAALETGQAGNAGSGNGNAAGAGVGNGPGGNAKPVQILQKDKEFIPRVTVIRAGTQVEFPNQDTVQHHVYSFSDAKRFDIPLYREVTPKPVAFEKPGIVVLGCNIHDWMKAYIYVTDAPYFSKSGPEGVIRIAGIKPERYRLAF